MDKLLNWSLAQQDPATAGNVPAPDPELLSKLFGGKDDVELMKESIQVVNHPEADLEAKITALENFEMLIENLDNANNIENLKLWDALISLLDNEETEIVNLVCSIIGTSVQNNEKCQQDFVSHPTGVSKLISLTSQKQIQAKSLYALSNLIRNNAKGYKLFDEYNGWSSIGPIISSPDSSNKVKLRSLSLLTSILSVGSQDDIFTHIKTHGIVSHILSIIDDDQDISLIDKSLNVITTLVHAKYEFTTEEVAQIQIKAKFIEEHLLDKINLDDFQILKQV